MSENEDEPGSMGRAPDSNVVIETINGLNGLVKPLKKYKLWNRYCAKRRLQMQRGSIETGSTCIHTSDSESETEVEEKRGLNKTNKKMRMWQGYATQTTSKEKRIWGRYIERQQFPVYQRNFKYSYDESTNQPLEADSEGINYADAIIAKEWKMRWLEDVAAITFSEWSDEGNTESSYKRPSSDELESDLSERMESEEGQSKDSPLEETQGKSSQEFESLLMRRNSAAILSPGDNHPLNLPKRKETQRPSAQNKKDTGEHKA